MYVILAVLWKVLAASDNKQLDSCCQFMLDCK